MFGEPLIWPKHRPKMKESHCNIVKWHIESNLNFKLILLYYFWPVWCIGTKFEILAILMWNHLKPIPKIRFWPKWWPNLANFGPNFEKNQIGSILHQKVLLACCIRILIWPFGYLAKWPNFQISVKCFKMCKILNIPFSDAK